MNKYKWTINTEIQKLLIELESVKFLIGNISSSSKFEENIRKHSLLKSAVFSARIEGFLDTINSPKKESQNLVSAYRFIFSSRSPQKLGINLIKKIHQKVLKNLSINSGKWRTESWAIFSESGGAVYLAPPHFEIPLLMTEYVHYVNNLSEHPCVKAAISQFIFEKIHPFADGNGRVGRLISAFILKKNGFGFKGLAPFEEYIDSHRDDYYYFLESNTDCSGFIKFFLESLLFQTKQHLEKLSNEREVPEDSLLPRRRELLEIIRDHPNSSFDFLQRRFLTVNHKTLHYDLLQLQKHGLIRKLGTTKATVYVANISHAF